MDPTAKRVLKTVLITLGIIGFLYGLFLFYGYFLAGNSDRKTSQQLQAPAEERVIVYETDQVIFKFGYQSFKMALDKVYQDHDHEPLTYTEFAGSLTRLSLDLPNSFPSEYSFSGATCLGLCLGGTTIYDELLRAGQAVVYDKSAKKFVDKVIWHEWSENCGPLCGGGGSAWELPNGTIILKGMNYVS